MLVVVADVNRKDSFQVPAVDDEEPVETLAADGADPVGAGNSGAVMPASSVRARRWVGRVSARGGSVGAGRGFVVVLVAAAISRIARSAASLGAGEGDRAPSPPSAAGARAAGRASAVDAG